MSDKSLPILLNAGLDFVTPPLLAKPGALIDCLNYEITALSGYRRLDGYERYDGWTDGGVANFFVATIVADVPVDQAQMVQGTLLGRLNTITSVAEYFGVVVGVAGTSVSYVPFRRTDTINNGQKVYILTPAGANYFFTATSNSTSGLTLATDAAAYTQQLRNYSAQLRANVAAFSSSIAGLNYSRDRLYLAVDSPMATITSATALAANGSRVRWKGQYWIIQERKTITVGPPATWQVGLVPQGAATPVNTNFVVVDSAGTTITDYGVQAADPIYDGSLWAYMVYAKNSDIATTRGYVPIPSASTFAFNTGKAATAAGLDLNASYWLVNGANVIKVRLADVVASSGDWVAGTKVGRASVVSTQQVGGTRITIVSGDVLHNAYPTTGSSAVMTTTSIGTPAVLAGTGALLTFNTRYQWGTYNFYARSDLKQLYGVNGVYRAFWAEPTAWGNIFTQADPLLDNPKYLSMHARSSLALGFADGSIQLSVPGVPYNFNGVDGAAELASGDDVTGMLEAVSDSTLVFGRRSIGRITGSSTANYDLKTVVANAGAYDYTAVNVGGMPVFTDQWGVSTLDQSNAYGDFVGQRSTYPISTWLTPRLVPSQDSIETGGVACAMPVREKMQYRLFLNSGEVVSVCFTGEGPKPMISNYAVQTTSARSVRVPIAWSSEVADTGKEMMHVVWDAALSRRGQDGSVGTIPNPRQAYRMDYGWGYDGVTFTHHFDLAHNFVDNGARFFQVDTVRLYGQGYGVASLEIKSSSIETDFDQDFTVRGQDISLPPIQKHFYDGMKNVTSIIDHANWGLGTKFRIKNVTEENSALTEPSHICQVLVMYMTTEGGAVDG